MNVDRVTKYDPLKVGATDILENKIHYTESSSRSSFPVVAKCINQLFMFFFLSPLVMINGMMQLFRVKKRI